MPIMRGKVNKALKKHSQAKADYTAEHRNTFDYNAANKIWKAEKNVSKAVNSRKKGVKGLIRKVVAGEEANARRKNIAAIRKKKSTHNGLAKVLLGKMPPGTNIRVISVRNNVREVTLRGSSPGGNRIFVTENGEKKALRSSQIKRVDRI